MKTEPVKEEEEEKKKNPMKTEPVRKKKKKKKVSWSKGAAEWVSHVCLITKMPWLMETENWVMETKN